MENMTVRLKRHKGLVKTIAVIAALVLSGWLYHELHPTIIFHTPQESKYLGKIVCTADGDLEKLYIENHTVRYRLPYLWSWKEEDWRFRSKGPQKTDDYFGVKPPKKDPIINKKGRELGSRASIFRSIATQLS